MSRSAARAFRGKGGGRREEGGGKGGGKEREGNATSAPGESSYNTPHHSNNITQSEGSEGSEGGK